MSKILVWSSVAVACIGAILLIVVAATPSYYHVKSGGIEIQQGAWQACVVSSSFGTQCSTVDVTNAQEDDKNRYQSIRAFLVFGLLLSFVMIALPIIGHFVPSYDGLLLKITGALSIIAGFCLAISWSIVAGIKPQGIDLFYGFGLQVVITVFYWIIGMVFIMVGMDTKHSQVTKNMAKQTESQKQDTHNQLAGAWQTTQQAMPQQHQQPQYAQQQPQYGYPAQQPPQYNPQYGQPQTGYAPQQTQGY